MLNPVYETGCVQPRQGELEAATLKHVGGADSMLLQASDALIDNQSKVFLR